jgi:pimeloyl-ACP methyl ester carboxylesterase
VAAWQRNGYDSMASFVVVAGHSLRALASAALILAARILIGAFIVVGLMIRQVIGTAKYFFEQVQDMWRAVEPYLWKLDEWLEAGMSALRANIATHLGRYEVAKHIQTITRPYKKEAGFLSGLRHTQAHSAAIEPIIKSQPDSDEA